MPMLFGTNLQFANSYNNRTYQKISKKKILGFGIGQPAHSQETQATRFDGGNPILAKWLKTGTEQLVPLIAAVKYLIDPDVIFLVGRLPENIYGCMQKRILDGLPPHRIPRKSSRPELEIASSGIDAAALGVATLPLYTILAPVPELLMKHDPRHPDHFGPDKSYVFL